MSSRRPWLALVVVAVAGCHSPGNGAAATPGKASMEFVALSDSALTVTVVNGLGRAIYIRGGRWFPGLPIDVMAENVEIFCYTGEQLIGPIGITPESGPYVEVPPGQRATVRVQTNYPQTLRGAECSATLMLKDEMKAGPAKFVVPKR